MKLNVQSAVCCHKGNVRGNNEDSFFLNGVYMPLERMDEGGLFVGASKENRQVYAVCDGMGGEENGEIASSMMAAVLVDLLNALNAGKPVRKAIDEIVQKTNAAICAMQKGAGCTLALLCLHDGQATVAWLGDSRVYLLRQGNLYRLSEDHTQSQRLMNMGVLDDEAAKSHATRHVLTRYLGMEMAELALHPSYGEEQTLKKGDAFLLCSDGLTDMLEEEMYAQYLNATPEQAVNTLVEGALAAGGKDNVTAMVVEIEECRRGWFSFG